MPKLKYEECVFLCALRCGGGSRLNADVLVCEPQMAALLSLLYLFHLRCFPAFWTMPLCMCDSTSKKGPVLQPESILGFSLP